MIIESNRLYNLNFFLCYIVYTTFYVGKHLYNHLTCFSRLLGWPGQHTAEPWSPAGPLASLSLGLDTMVTVSRPHSTVTSDCDVMSDLLVCCSWQYAAGSMLLAANNILLYMMIWSISQVLDWAAAD